MRGYNEKNVGKNEEHVKCALEIKSILSSKGVNTQTKGGVDEAGTWVEIYVENPTPSQLKCLAKVKSEFESSLERERPDRPRSNKGKMKVDYISIKVKYTKDFKESVWNWVQSKFEKDMGNLPKCYVQLDQYHVGRESHVSAFQMINLAIFDRFKEFSFWSDRA